MPDTTGWEASGGHCLHSPYWAEDVSRLQGSDRGGPGGVLAGHCSLGRGAWEPLVVACSPFQELLPMGPTAKSHFLRAVWLLPDSGSSQPESVEP